MIGVSSLRPVIAIAYAHTMLARQRLENIATHFNAVSNEELVKYKIKFVRNATGLVGQYLTHQPHQQRFG